MAVEKSLEAERLGAHAAHELAAAAVFLHHHWRRLLHLFCTIGTKRLSVGRQWILDPMASVDELKRCVFGETKSLLEVVKRWGGGVQEGGAPWGRAARVGCLHVLRGHG